MSAVVELWNVVVLVDTKKTPIVNIASVSNARIASENRLPVLSTV